MRTWEEWSDLDVNYKVGEIYDKKNKEIYKKEPKVLMIKGFFCRTPIFYENDYCNVASDIYPIILKYGISMLQQDNKEGWCVYRWDNDDAQYWHKNPLRAAAIVFLMMNGVNPNS